MSATLIVLLLGCASCSSGVEAQRTRFAPEAAAAAALAAYDKNGDGALDAEELEASPGLQSAVPRIDKNRDGNLTADEISARMEAYQSQSDFVATQIQVGRQGQPAADVRIVFEPEPFMGDGLQSYVCVTDAGGAGFPEGETVETPGLPLGFYKVTISPPGGTAVVQGCEMADDVTNANRLQFAL